jgi:HD-GYP domain-containing protein (c-di-GMP phosphodiesterase class II)
MRSLAPRRVVHDTGKIGVPEHILIKLDSLTEAEQKVMKEHPATEERIFSPLKSFHLVLPMISTISKSSMAPGVRKA